MRVILRLLIIGFLGLMLVLSGCVQDNVTDDGETNEEPTSEKMSFTAVVISDAPSDNFSHINVTFSQIKIHKSENDNDSGWTTFNSDPKTIDLIYLHENNLTGELGVQNISVGNYNKLWINVDNATGILKDNGEEITFDVPSNVLKIQQSFEIKEGNTTIDVELDLDKSVLYVPQGDVYTLLPVIGKMKVEHGDSEKEEKEEEDERLIAYYKFDESSGTVVKDSAGVYDSTVHGNAVFKIGKKGNSVYFDGIDDFIQLPQNAIDDIGNLTQGAISFWFNYSSILDNQTIMPIFFIGNEDPNDQDSIFIIEIGHSDTEAETLTVDPNNKNLYATWTDLTQNSDPILCYDTNENIQENTWNHFALVVDPTGNTGYLNGVELDNRRYNFGSLIDDIFLAEIPVKELFTIGYGKTHQQISPNFVYFKGYIDELKIFNEPLSSEEIQELI